MQPVFRHAEELLRETEQLTSADSADTADTTAAAAETCRYETLMQRYHNVVANVTSLISVTTESIHKRDSLKVSLSL